jgi:PHD/YefM family antitoxin component YafN of YafNO toxin-antitoxin module
MRTLAAERAVLVTNHGQAEAVIVQPEAYADLLEKVERAESRIEADLEMLRRRFDERLASLTAAKAGERLRSVMRGKAKLGGKVKAGTSY